MISCMRNDDFSFCIAESENRRVNGLHNSTNCQIMNGDRQLNQRCSQRYEPISVFPQNISRTLWLCFFLSAPQMFEKRANRLLFARCAILSLLSHHRGKKRYPSLGKSVWRTYNVLRRKLSHSFADELS